jgi:hypothetical protein
LTGRHSSVSAISMGPMDRPGLGSGAEPRSRSRSLPLTGSSPIGRVARGGERGRLPPPRARRPCPAAASAMGCPVPGDQSPPLLVEGLEGLLPPETWAAEANQQGPHRRASRRQPLAGRKARPASARARLPLPSGTMSSCRFPAARREQARKNRTRRECSGHCQLVIPTNYLAQHD